MKAFTNESIWKGRDDGPEAPRFHQKVESISIDDLQQAQSLSFAILGFACDEGVKRNQGNPGAKEGPNEIRRALANLPFLGSDQAALYDCGDIVCQGGDLETAQENLASAVKILLEKGHTPIILGGGHEIAWGHYKGIIQAKPDHSCSILNFDAHYDLRPLLKDNKGSSGTPFLQIANYLEELKKPFSYSCYGIQRTGNTAQLFQTADKLSVHTIEAKTFHLDGIQEAERAIQKLTEQTDPLYLTICLDVFAEAYAPGVSARQSLGLTPWHVLPLISQLASSGKVLSMDIAELCPRRDREGITAKLAAELIHTFITNFNLVPCK